MSAPSLERQGVLACTDAERRRAQALAGDLRAAGRDVRVVTVWVRPAWWLIQALCAAGGVAASVVAVDHQITGLVIAAAALLIAVLHLAGAPLIPRLSPARATQNVISTPPSRAGVRDVTVILTAPLDDRRRGIGEVLPFRITTAALLALGLLTALLGARAAGAEGLWLNILQLLPTLALLALVALLVEGGLAAPKPGGDAAQVVIAATQRLDALPPRNVDVAVVLAGTGYAHAAGLSEWLRGRRRRGLEPSAIAIVHLEASFGGGPAWRERDGLLSRPRAHPQLLTAARRAGASEGVAPDVMGEPPHNPEAAIKAGQPPAESRHVTAAGIVGVRGWPAIAISADAAFAERLVRELDLTLSAD